MRFQGKEHHSEWLGFPLWISEPIFESFSKLEVVSLDSWVLGKDWLEVFNPWTGWILPLVSKSGDDTAVSDGHFGPSEVGTFCKLFLHNSESWFVSKFDSLIN